MCLAGQVRGDSTSPQFPPTFHTLNKRSLMKIETKDFFLVMSWLECCWSKVLNTWSAFLNDHSINLSAWSLHVLILESSELLAGILNQSSHITEHLTWHHLSRCCRLNSWLQSFFCMLIFQTTALPKTLRQIHHPVFCSIMSPSNCTMSKHLTFTLNIIPEALQFFFWQSEVVRWSTFKSFR